MKVQVEIEEDYMMGDSGMDIPSLRISCSKCGYSVEVFGQGEGSAKHGARMLREQCPENESNFYDIGD